MLLLFDSASGFALFKVQNEGKVDEAKVRGNPSSALAPFRSARGLPLPCKPKGWAQAGSRSP